MTCKEKYMQEHPDCDWECIVYACCPSDYGYLDNPRYCCQYDISACQRCWNREIPENKKEKNTMTCREKLIAEHPEWSEVVIMKCTDIFTPNEYFTIDGPELLWSDIYPGVVVECSEDEDGKDAKIKQLESDKGALLNELIEKRKRVAELVEVYSASLTEIDILKEKNDNQRSIIEGNGETLNNLHNQIQDLLEKIELRDEEIDKLVEENEKLRKSVDILSDGVDRREKENTGLYNKVSNLTAFKLRNDTLETNWRVVSDENKILRAEHNTQAESIKDLLESNDKFKEDIESRNREIAKHVMEITELTATIKAKDKQISELVDLVNIKSEYATSLNSMLNDRIEKYQTLRANIEMAGFEVGDDNTVIVRPDKPHFATNEEVADKFNSCSTNCAMYPTDIARTIARTMRDKYEALIYVGFSHDDAMGLIPMWTD